MRDSSGIALSREMVGVAAAVVVLVGAPHDPRAPPGAARSAPGCARRATGCVSTTSRSSAVSGPGFVRIRVGIPIFPMSWKQRAELEPLQLVRLEPELRADAEREVGDPARVCRRVLVVGLERVRERLDGREERALEGLVARRALRARAWSGGRCSRGARARGRREQVRLGIAAAMTPQRPSTVNGATAKRPSVPSGTGAIAA